MSSTLAAKIEIVNKPIIFDVMSYYLDIPNNTHYPNDYSRRSNRFPDTSNYKVMKSVQDEYYIRLYYHYKYVLSVGGSAYFYTLTYNDNALPHYGDVPCLDYNDLRYFLRSSGFDKVLLRKYGLKLGYFITCELGEGKGKRGIENNPHYHCIFFLTPFKSEKPHEQLTPSIFSHLVKTYWQGANYENVRRRDYKYGVACEGDNLGVINSPHALSYVVKYVGKDLPARLLERKLCAVAIRELYGKLLQSCFIQTYWLRYAKKKYPNLEAFEALEMFKTDLDVKLFVHRLFKRFYKRKLLNRFSAKVRISQGIGISALHELNPDGLTVTIPYNNSIRTVNIPSYIYRKLYYDIIKDAKSNNKYILNDKGIEMRLKSLHKSMKLYSDALEMAVQLNAVDFDVLVSPDSSFVSYARAKELYPAYCAIYRNRLCPDITHELHYESDLQDFLIFDTLCSRYYESDETLFYFNGKRTYSSHVTFQPYMKYFNLFDNLIEKKYLWDSDELYRRYLQYRSTRRHISKDKFLSKLPL